MLFIRKPNEDRHHGSYVHGNTTNFENSVLVFVDDFIDSGKTLCRLMLATAPLGGIKLVCLSDGVDSVESHRYAMHVFLTPDEKKYYSGLLRF